MQICCLAVNYPVSSFCNCLQTLGFDVSLFGDLRYTALKSGIAQTMELCRFKHL